MEMLTYIGAIQKNMIDEYGFAENPEKPGVPMHVPDGIYPMKIDGKTDFVIIVEGRISCCNFKPNV